jgi:hypothetical protein
VSSYAWSQQASFSRYQPGRTVRALGLKSLRRTSVSTGHVPAYVPASKQNQVCVNCECICRTGDQSCYTCGLEPTKREVPFSTRAQKRLSKAKAAFNQVVESIAPPKAPVFVAKSAARRWTDRELMFLRRYGKFYQDLELGFRKPLTDSHRQFVAVCRGERKAETIHEVAYQKYIKSRRAGVIGQFSWEFCW